MAANHKRFFWILAAAFGATLLPVFALNLILLNDTLGNSGKVLLASQWQQRTQGVTYAPTLSDTHLFKTLRLNDRLPEIDTVVFGSSTAMGVTQQAFPDTLHVYNYAQSGHGLSASLGEAEYLQRHAPQVKWLAIPLDWSIGFVYQQAPVQEADLSAAAAMMQAQSPAQQTPLLARMRDALSWPRVATLFGIFKSILRADDKLAAFRGYFLDAGSADYRCADGAPAKDFDTVHRGTCTGFRHDGSATFANSSRVANAQARIPLAVTGSSQYRRHLVEARGIPSAHLLERLAVLAERARANGGGVILFMPPLLPGMEVEFLRHPELAAYLQETKRALDDWARAQNVAILDAGQSERFGCAADEFIDEHHAISSCYEKIFRPFWRDALRLDGTIELPAGGLM
jgi:hypothetical protein